MLAARLFISHTFKPAAVPRNLGITRNFSQVSGLWRKQDRSCINKIGMHFRKSGTVASNATQTSVPASQKIVGSWLLSCGGVIFGSVVLGSLSRLSDQSQPMLTLNLFGMKPPSTDAEWEEELKKYQQYPQFKTKEITIDQFKHVWLMEYRHRLWTCALGAVFFIPATVFWARGWLKSGLKRRSVLFGVLVALQGLVGWNMAKSGLKHDENNAPHVSQYRRAGLVSLTFFLYTFYLWSGLFQLLPVKPVTDDVARKTIRHFRKFVNFSKGAVFLTVVSGAFVAALDAGLINTSLPKTDDMLSISPKWRNVTDNPTTVVFGHRILGMASLAYISGLWLWSRKLKLPPRAFTAVTALTVMTCLQVGLGVTALMTSVPVPVAVSHQSGSLMTLSLAIWLAYELRLIRYLPK